MVERSPAMELLRPETTLSIIAMFGVLTGNDLAAGTFSEGTPAATASTPATGVGTGGAARTWHPRLREMAMTLENFMMMVDSGYWETIG
jgi:hypothetical protein